jgi:hypothetical protein
MLDCVSRGASLISLHSVMGQSRPSTVASHKSIRCWLRLCPGPKPVPAASRIDRVFNVVVNKYSTFVYPCRKLPKGNCLCPLWNASRTPRHFRSILHITSAQKVLDDFSVRSRSGALGSSNLPRSDPWPRVCFPRSPISASSPIVGLFGGSGEGPFRGGPKGRSAGTATIISLAIPGLIYTLCQVGATFYLARD